MITIIKKHLKTNEETIINRKEFVNEHEHISLNEYEYLKRLLDGEKIQITKKEGIFRYYIKCK